MCGSKGPAQLEEGEKYSGLSLFKILDFFVHH